MMINVNGINEKRILIDSCSINRQNTMLNMTLWHCDIDICSMIILTQHTLLHKFKNPFSNRFPYVLRASYTATHVPRCVCVRALLLLLLPFIIINSSHSIFIVNMKCENEQNGLCCFVYFYHSSFTLNWYWVLHRSFTFHQISVIRLAFHLIYEISKSQWW